MAVIVILARVLILATKAHSNYRTVFQNAQGILDLHGISDTSLHVVGRPQWCLDIAASEWFAKGCNALTDGDDTKSITRAINGEVNGR